MAMTTKLGRTVAHFHGLLPIQSQDPLIVWFCNIMWQNKIVTSGLPQRSWPPNLGR